MRGRAPIVAIVVLIWIGACFSRIRAQGSGSDEDTNLVINPGFEDGQYAWMPYSADLCSISTSAVLSGLYSLECRNPGPSHKQLGLKQTIILNQEIAQPIVISGYSKAEMVAGSIPIFYGVYAEVRYEDGSTLATSALFFEGSHDWSYSEKVIWSSNDLRITTVELFVTFNNHTGAAWFDDIDLSPYEVLTDFNYGLKYLIIAVDNEDLHIAPARQALESVGSKYDILLLVDKMRKIVWKNIPLPLETADETGKYAGVITTTNNFVHMIDGRYQAILHEAHLLQLENYYNKYHVKHVCMYAYPYESLGVTPTLPGSPYPADITIPGEITALITGIPKKIVVPVTHSYMYPSVIADPSRAKPAIFVNTSGDPASYVAGAFVSSISGWHNLYYFVDHATWSLHTKILGNFWFQWLSNGIYLGMRRIYLQPQIDDYFLPTGIFDSSRALNDQEDNTDMVRIDGDDMRQIVEWQDELNKILPRGSHFVTEIAYNGDGVKTATLDSDTLFQQTLLVFGKFFWESHTFTHPNLTALNYSRVLWELGENIRFSEEVFFPRVVGSVDEFYSPSAMVTPSISGLFTRDSLMAMFDSGIRNVVGDNSVTALLPINPYHGIYTSTNIHGYPGIFIVPRQATNIFYNTHTPETELSQFNKMYASAYGRPLSLEEVLTIESDVANGLLVAYRHDPYMFHQANLKIFNYNGKNTTLYTLWVDRVVEKLLKYVTLPVLSVKHDDLAEVWKARMERDKCEVNSTVIARNGKAMELIVSSKQACVTAITGLILGPCCGCPHTKVEAYGPDVTTYIALPGNNVPFVLPLLVPKQLLS